MRRYPECSELSRFLRLSGQHSGLLALTTVSASTGAVWYWATWAGGLLGHPHVGATPCWRVHSRSGDGAAASPIARQHLLGAKSCWGRSWDTVRHGFVLCSCCASGASSALAVIICFAQSGYCGSDRRWEQWKHGGDAQSRRAVMRAENRLAVESAQRHSAALAARRLRLGACG